MMREVAAVVVAVFLLTHSVLQVVRPRGTLVDALHENVVQHLAHRDLGVLELGESVYHHCIVEVLFNHGFKNFKVVSGELADALVQRARHFRVRTYLPVYHLLYVVFALSHVDAELG